MIAREAGSQRDKSKVDEKYKLIGSRQSYFTQKLQAGLQWYFPLDYEFVVKGPDTAQEIELRAGTHQIPVLITPEDWCVADTTPILSLLDSRLSVPRFYPRGIIGALSAVTEEYFVEWAARWCIHTRWQTTEETAQHASGLLVKEQNISEDIREAVQKQMIGWGRRAGRAIGVNSEIQKSAAEKEIVRIFQHFEAHLEKSPFVFGKLPTAVDTVIMGGLRAHFLRDIYPKGLLESLDKVRKWHEDFSASIQEHIQHPFY